MLMSRLGFTLGRVYSLTMLFNLNRRATARRECSTAHPSSSYRDVDHGQLTLGSGVISASPSLPDVSQMPGLSLDCGGAAVHRTTIVHMDDGTKTYARVCPARVLFVLFECLLC